MQGHLDQSYHLFAFLKKKHNSVMVFDTTDPDVGDAQFAKEDWNNIVYGPALSTRGNLARARTRGAGSPQTVEHCYFPH